ncbi:MAG: hypothetical protein Roseis2KO_43240 [Roseivirga sp.]
MNKRQLKTSSVEQRQNNGYYHPDTADDHNQRKSVSSELKIGNPNLFDILNNAFLGTYREVFNAWDPTESKVFTFMKTVCDWLTHMEQNSAKTPLTLQLIPIDPQQDDTLIEMKRLQ